MHTLAEAADCQTTAFIIASEGAGFSDC